MLKHIVLFKLKSPTPAIIEEAKTRIKGMAGKIPVLLHLEVGIDILHSERSFDIGLECMFESLEDMQLYQVHPIHVAVAEYMTSIREKSVTLDYEIE